MEYQPLCSRSGETVVLETDFCGDVDDAAALSLLCFEARRHPGAFRLGAVSCNVRSPFAAAALKTILAASGMEDVPVGVTADAPPPGGSGCESRFLRGLAARWHGGTPPAPVAATALWRGLLASAADTSVTVVSIGFFNTLDAVLAADPALFHRKVRAVVAMAGGFGRKAGYVDFNVREWPDASRRFFEAWRGPTVFIGSESGEHVATDLSGLPPQYDPVPLVEAFRHFVGPAMSCASWDPVTVDFAVNGAGSCYALGDPGFVRLAADGSTPFTPDPAGNARVLRLAAYEPDISRRITSLVRASAGLPPLGRKPAPPADPWA